MASQTPSKSGVADEKALILFYRTFREFLNVDSAFNESHRVRLQSNRAQQKLLRLSPVQFDELSTDVYDELQRRLESNHVDQPGPKPDFSTMDRSDESKCLAPRDNFHPKRNQARQKLSVLSVARFNDLSFDILFEIERRLKAHPTQSAQETVQNPISAFLASPSATGPKTSPKSAETSQANQVKNGQYLPEKNEAQNPNTFVPTAYSSSNRSSQNSQTSQPAQSPSSSRDSGSHNVAQIAPPPYDNASSNIPQPIKAVTKNIVPAKSTLTEDYDSESDSNLHQSRQPPASHEFNIHCNTNDGYDQHEDDDAFSEVDDQQEEVFHDAGASSQDLVGAAAKAWASKNSSHADLSKLSSASLEQQQEEPSQSQPQDYSSHQDFSQSDFSSHHSDLQLFGPLSLQSIAEEKGPYIPPNLLANGQTSSSSSAHLEGKRKSLSEQISSSIGRPRSVSKADLDGVNSQRRVSDPRLSSDSRLSADASKQSQYAALEAKLKDQTEQIKSLTAQSTKLSTQLSTSNSTKESLEKENKKLRDRIAAAEEEQETEHEKVEEMVEELEKIKAAAAAQEKEMEERSNEFGQKTEQYITDLEDKQKIIEELQEQVKSIQEKLNATEQQHLRLQDKYSQIMNKQSDYAGSSASLSSQIMLLEGKLIKHESTITDLQEQVEEKEGRIKEDQKEFKTWSSKLEEKQKELEVKTKEIEAKNRELKEKNEKLEENDAQIASLLTQLSQNHNLKAEEPANAKVEGSRSLDSQLPADTQKTVGSKDSGDNSKQYLALVKERDALQSDYNKLRVELEQQQIVTEQVRQEASSFLEEMRTLAESTDGVYTNEKYLFQIEELKKEVADWKQRCAKVKSKLRSLKSNSYSAIPHARATRDGSFDDESLQTVDTKYLSADGKILDTNVIKFQVAMDEFLVKLRTTPTKQVMDHLHGVVATTRVITNDVNDNFMAEKYMGDNSDSQRYDERHGGMENDSQYRSIQEFDRLQSDLAQATALVSATATHLITTTRSHATSGGISPLLLVDAAASDLTQAVVDLIKLAKIKPTDETRSAEGHGLGLEETPEGFSNDYAHRKNRNGSGGYHAHKAGSSSGKSHKTHSKAHNQAHSHGLPLPPTFSQETRSASGPLPPPHKHRQNSAAHETARSVSGPVGLEKRDPASQSSNMQPAVVPLTKETTLSQSPPSPSAFRSAQPSVHTDANVRNDANRENASNNKGKGERFGSGIHSRTTPSHSLDYDSFPQVSPMKPSSYTTRNAGGSSAAANFEPVATSNIMENPENRTVKDLRQYLGTQTVSVISSIQTLLTDIREGAGMNTLRRDILATVECVRPVVDATSRSMTQSRKLKETGAYFVNSLDSCCDRLTSIHKASLEDEQHQQHQGSEKESIPDKQLKQRLAGIAFDMASSTKELVKKVEEVALGLEISEIDDELNKV